MHDQASDAERLARISYHLSGLLRQSLQVEAMRPLASQGAVNGHWRLALKFSPDDKGISLVDCGPGSSLILRCRQPLDDDGEPSTDQNAAFPARFLNSMAQQHEWHEHARAAGAATANSFGWFEDEAFGPCLILEDLAARAYAGGQGPALRPLVGLALDNGPGLRAAISQALAELIAFHRRPASSRSLDQASLQQPAIPDFCEQDWRPLRTVIGFAGGLALAEQAQRNIQELYGRQEGQSGPTALHGDFRLANLLSCGPLQNGAEPDKSGVYLVDFDFSGLGLPAEDLGWLSAPCWSAGPAQDQALSEAWLLERYQQLGGCSVSSAALRRAKLKAQMRWLSIALLQSRRTGRALDQLYAAQPQQHPVQVLKDALKLAEQV